MKKILIIGAGFLQDFVIKQAKKDGYTVLAVDADPNAVGFQHADEHAVIDIVDKEACLRYAIDKKIDGVITAATEFGVLTTAYIAEKMKLPGNSCKLATIVKNKYLTKKCLIDAGVDGADNVFLVRNGDSLDNIKPEIKYPVIVKPYDGAGSRGVTKVLSEEELDFAVPDAIKKSVTGGAYIESFFEGEEYGIESIVVSGKVMVLGVMKKLMTKPPYYAELGHAIPPMISVELEQKIKDCAENAIKAIGISSGAVNMDAIVTADEKVHIVDFGARMGGNLIGSHIIPYGTGYDYISALVKVAVGDEPTLVQKEHTAVATRILAFQKGHIDKAPDIEKIEKDFGVEICHHITDNMDVNEYHANGDGLGYIVARADSFEEATSKANKAYEYMKAVLFGK